MARIDHLHIYQDGIKLLGLALDVQTQMRRDFKRTLGEKIHLRCVDMLEAIAMANASREAARVEWIDTLLQQLRATTVLLRAGHDHKLISNKLWADAVELLDGIGAQAGGWRKHTTGEVSAAPAA